MQSLGTAEPRFNEPRYSKVPVITKYFLGPGKITVICMGKNPDITNPRYSENPGITEPIFGPEATFYPDSDMTKFTKQVQVF